MIGWLIRLLLVAAGFITSFFIGRDSVNFSVIQMVVGILLFTIVIIILAIWPVLKSWFKRTF